MVRDQSGATEQPGGGPAAAPGPGERPAQALIGAALFEARIAAGLTAVQVGEVTRISPELLRRLEAGQFEACGGDVYARGHIRAAALAVGLDPQPLLAWYGAVRLPPLTKRDLRKPRVAQADAPTGRAKPPSGADRARTVLPSIVPGVVPSLVPMAGQTPPPDLPPLRRARRNDFTDADAGTAARLSMVDREPGRGPVRDDRPAAFLPGAGDQRRAGPNWSLALLGALVAVGLTAAVQLWPQSALSSTGTQDSAHTVKAPAQAVGVASAPAKPSAAAPTAAPAPKPTSPVVLQITTKAVDSWVGVTNAAGEHLFWDVQQPGQTQQFTDKSQLSVTVGNAAAVDLTVNGREIGAPGPAGQVYQATFGPQN
ncbi:MAG TPA: helix-turn-helix domain-containing protein [Actinocrinis sp.]|nr:helix-turn-helix domain-containing protein [Actinocrinis sp.]